MTTKNIVPRAAGEGSIGTVDKPWGACHVDGLTIRTGAGLNKVWKSDADGNGSWQDHDWSPPPTVTGGIGFSVDGAGKRISGGMRQSVVVPYNCTILGWHLVSDQPGYVVIDVWKKAGSLPSAADSITGTEKPSLGNAGYNNDAVLSTWSTDIAAGDILSFNVDSCLVCTRVTLSILVAKT